MKVTLTLDEQPRTVTPPRDLLSTLKAAGAGTLAKWHALSFTHQREHAEAVAGAKEPETRARRIARCVEMVRARPKPTTRSKPSAHARPARRATRAS